MPRKKKSLFRNLISLRRGNTAPAKPRTARQPGPQIDNLEGRVVLSQFGFPGQGFGALSRVPAQFSQDPGMIQEAPMLFSQGSDMIMDVAPDDGGPAAATGRFYGAQQGPAFSPARGIQGVDPRMSFDVQGEGGPTAGTGMRNVRVANGFGTAQGWRGEVNTTASYVTQSVSEASALPAQQAELLQAPTTPYALTNAPSSGQAVGGYRTLQAAPAAGFQTFQGSPYGGGFQTFQGTPSGGFQAIQGRPFAGGRGFTQAQGSVQDEQLAEHQETLRTDLDAVVGESAVTDGQRWAFKKDVRSLAEAGLPLDPEALSPVADGLLTAIADGSFEANRETIRGEFAATFAESSGDSEDADALSDDEVALVNQTFDHFVAIAKGLNLTTDKLDVLTADRKAIQDDLERLEVSTTGTPAPDSNLNLILSPNQGPGARFVRARP